MITNGRFPATHEMTTDEYGLRSMSEIDPVDLRMSLSGLPDLETDDDEQGAENVSPQFEVQDDNMIEFMHNIKLSSTLCFFRHDHPD